MTAAPGKRGEVRGWRRGVRGALPWLGCQAVGWKLKRSLVFISFQFPGLDSGFGFLELCKGWGKNCTSPNPKEARWFSVLQAPYGNTGVHFGKRGERTANNVTMAVH